MTSKADRNTFATSSRPLNVNRAVSGEISVTFAARHAMARSASPRSPA